MSIVLVCNVILLTSSCLSFKWQSYLHDFLSTRYMNVWQAGEVTLFLQGMAHANQYNHFHVAHGSIPCLCIVYKTLLIHWPADSF
jgi:hypothetical protein